MEVTVRGQIQLLQWTTEEHVRGKISLLTDQEGQTTGVNLELTIITIRKPQETKSTWLELLETKALQTSRGKEENKGNENIQEKEFK